MTSGLVGKRNFKSGGQRIFARWSRVTASGIAALILATTLAAGQSKESYPPAINDLLPGYSLKQGTFPAVLGLTPGMAFAEVEAILKPRLLKEMDITEQIYSLTHPDDGREFGFAFRTWFMAHLTTDAPKAGDVLSGTLTSNLTGGRLASISRTVSYSQTPAQFKPNFDSTLATIIAAYGRPSVQSSSVLYYLYWNGELDQSGSQARLDQCRYVGQRLFYDFSQQRIDKYPDCTALIEVTLTRDYKVANLLEGFSVKVTDYRRIYDDAVSADQYLLDGLNAAQGVDGGGNVSL